MAKKSRSTDFSSPSPVTAKERRQQERWEIESDLRTLSDAEDIRSDPDRLARAEKLLDEQRQAIDRAARGRRVSKSQKAT